MPSSVEHVVFWSTIARSISLFCGVGGGCRRQLKATSGQPQPETAARAYSARRRLGHLWRRWPAALCLSSIKFESGMALHVNFLICLLHGVVSFCVLGSFEVDTASTTSQESV